MKPTLLFTTTTFQLGNVGQESSLPALTGAENIQNKTAFYLDEDDEIFEGYGRLATSYPYRQYNSYTREITPKELKIAILENDYLKATFIPDFGGRLWELIDKQTGENLLYTNDVIRPSNLAIRNAWFSGGVEWNIGMIGHTPFTMDPMFVSHLQDDSGNPILRMYEYERIRNVTYQMDFWLEEHCPYLKCRMRIHNQTANVTPMYWWSNIAVPEYDGGMVVTPADEAYTCSTDDVTKTSIPYSNGIDISHYKNVPIQTDFFFNLPDDVYRYEANINAEGYGLLQLSSKRLRGRKFFCWGNNTGSDTWQGYLTEHAGRYLEIQAGLGKTQYGCIPMPPHTAWEWMEYYGAVQIDAPEHFSSFENARAYLNAEAKRIIGPDSIYFNGGIEEEVKARKKFSLKQGTRVQSASGYGSLENVIRTHQGEPSLPMHLDFASDDARQQDWLNLLARGTFPCPDANATPLDYCGNEYLYQKLVQYTRKEKENWYAWLQRGCYEYHTQQWRLAASSLKHSLACAENPVALYVTALLQFKNKKRTQALETLRKTVPYRTDDLGFIKEVFGLFCEKNAYEYVLESYEMLTKELKNDSRILYFYIEALANTGRTENAYELLTADGGLLVADIRECNCAIGELWKQLHTKLYGDSEAKIPARYQFNSFLKD